ncbi:hypothetical protein DPMN_029151 [Dreissena polymorpha]|uniref:Uncharacterized protein n=1 Tax=Dreissena polymorpha TaxID=45954 RepID=A0A9D4RFZ5_DREPO|nr:hypothetical protein DPMN_029151 [Dreissena polymorpha]
MGGGSSTGGSGGSGGSGGGGGGGGAGSGGGGGSGGGSTSTQIQPIKRVNYSAPSVSTSIFSILILRLRL